MNSRPVLTIGCTIGLDHYPSLSEIISALNELNLKGYVIKATEVANEIGDPVLMNMVMIGALCAVSEFYNLDEIKTIVAEGSRTSLIEANLDALEKGAQLIYETAELEPA